MPWYRVHGLCANIRESPVGPVLTHDDVIKWKHFPRYWTFVRGIHRSRWMPRTKASDAGLWCFLWCFLHWINDWVNNRQAGDLYRYPTHFDVIVMVPMLRADSGPDLAYYQSKWLMAESFLICGTLFLQARVCERDVWNYFSWKNSNSW